MMRRNNFFLIIVVMTTCMFLQTGCKPKRIIAERVVSQTDSFSVLQLKDSLYIKEIQLAIMESDLKRARAENINLKSETSRYEVSYDTNTKVDSFTNRAAVISEVFTINKNLYEQSVREQEILLREVRVENESLRKNNIDLQMIEKRETSSETGFVQRSFNAGFIVGMLLVLLLALLLLLLLRRCKFIELKT